MSENGKIQFIKWLVYGLEENGYFLVIVEGNFLLSSASFLGCHAMPRIQCRPVVLSAGKFLNEVQFNNMSASTVIAKNVRKYTSTPQLSITIFN